MDECVVDSGRVGSRASLSVELVPSRPLGRADRSDLGLGKQEYSRSCHSDSISTTLPYLPARVVDRLLALGPLCQLYGLFRRR